MDKKVLTYLLLSSFFLVAVFGFAGMGHSDAPGGCIASLSRGVRCPSAVNPLSAAQFHLNAFKSFSTAIFEISALTFLLALILLLLAVLPGPGTVRHLWADIADDLEQGYGDFLPPVLQEFLQWLSLREHSPTLGSGRE